MRDAGTVRPITYYGRPVLHQRCAEVTTFDDELAALVDDMFASMYAVGGVGLAANQIGVGLRVYVYDCTDADGERHAGHIVNPTLTTAVALAGTVTGPEGCLSVPGASADVPRAALATARGLDLHGVPISISGSGTLARCLQHEQDHLDGKVYVDLLDPAHRDRLLAKAGLSS